MKQFKIVSLALCAVLLLTTALVGCFPVKDNTDETSGKQSENSAQPVFNPLSDDDSSSVEESSVDLDELLKGLKVGGTVEFGHYEQDGNSENGKEPIEWLVLEIKDNKALLLSSKGLDCKKYHNNDVKIDWENCSLRSWLNGISDGAFYNDAFNDNEKERIVKSKVSAEENTDHPSISPGNETTDRVFLLSKREAEGLSLVGIENEKKCVATECAKKAAIENDDECVNSNGFSRWWLRTPGKDETHKAAVNTSGILCNDGEGFNIVRPALRINLPTEDSSGEESSKQDICTVTFNLNYEGAAGAPEAKTIVVGRSATKPQSDPERDNFNFGGWYREQDCKNEWKFESDTVTGDTVLFAKWTEKPYKITYTVNNVPVDEQRYNEGECINPPEYSPRVDYTFSGWKIPKTMPAKNITLDATLKPQEGSSSTHKVGDTVEFGHIGQNEEKIKWMILETNEDGGEALLISVNGIACQKYNDEDKGVTWKECSLRSWLNGISDGSFYKTAFNDREKEIIVESTVTADKNPDYSTYTSPGTYTKDRIYILSVEEARKYFEEDNKRMCQYEKEYVCWWLRTPGSFRGSAARVSEDGSINSYGYYVFGESVVRPVLRIDLSKYDKLNDDKENN